MRRKNVFKAYFCAFNMRMRGPWYVIKRFFASFATAIFRKSCSPPPIAKSINMVWGLHIALVKTKNILNLKMGLFEKLLSYVELIVLHTDYLPGPLFVRPPPSRFGSSRGASFGTGKGIAVFCWVEVVSYAQYCFYAIVNCIKILQKIELIQDFLP